MNNIFLTLTLISFFFYSCKQTNISETKIEEVEPQIINLEKINVTTDCAKDLFVLESFVPLSNDIIIGKTKRIIIEGDRIFILDETTPQIACFDLDGKLLYSIKNKGRGPEEFWNIKDIALNSASNELIAYDDGKRRLVKYDLRNGKFLSELSLTHIAPDRIAVKNGTYFFDNQYNRNHSIERKDMQYFLMYSKAGKEINARFLAHDEVADYNFLFQPFFYSMENLYYIKPFNNIVYTLEPGKVIPTYQILLPDPVPFNKIKEKMDGRELSASKYAFGLTDVFRSENYLHFIFSKDGFVVTTVYDLKEEKVLYCGKRVLCEPTQEMPFYTFIEGVYKDKFFAPVAAWNILKNFSEHELSPINKLENLSENDNPVIAFYRVKEKQI